MSRPKISEQDKRIVQVNIRLTTEENVKVNEYAKSSGLARLTGYAKRYLLARFQLPNYSHWMPPFIRN